MVTTTHHWQTRRLGLERSQPRAHSGVSELPLCLLSRGCAPGRACLVWLARPLPSSGSLRVPASQGWCSQGSLQASVFSLRSFLLVPRAPAQGSPTWLPSPILPKFHGQFQLVPPNIALRVGSNSPCPCQPTPARPIHASSRTQLGSYLKPSPLLKISVSNI